ncbi:MAG: glycosyltransferase family 4 protein [Candidatus Levybacteria bacterium]|nr:glycosyltransferase family 4 protein [Candidatus Levybacteria bacterium]
MKILFFTRLFYPHIGGVEKHILEISRILLKKGYSVVVVAERNDPNIKSEEILEGIQIHRINVGRNVWFKKFRIWKWLFENKYLIKEADVIHCHDVFFWYLPFRFLYRFKKVFTTFHGYESYPVTKRAIVVRRISEKLSKGNLCIGDFIKKWYGTKPTYVSYGGVKTSNMKMQNPVRISEMSAVFIGRLDEQTGIKTYVEAVKLIRNKIPDFKFEVVGDGRLSQEINKYFRVLGFKDNPEKFLLKHNFAFVSRYLSILEAMAAKKLVFAVFDNPIKEDYLKLSPFAKHIIISRSAKEISEKVLFYLKNFSDKDRKVKEAFKFAKNQSWGNVVDIYQKLWGINL